MSDPQFEPGKQLSSSEMAALAKDNERESAEAARLAKERQEQDIREGKKPVLSEVAERVKDQLEEKFGE